MDSLGTTSPQTCAAVVLVTESKVGVPGTCHGMMWTMLGDDAIAGTVWLSKKHGANIGAKAKQMEISWKKI